MALDKKFRDRQQPVIVMANPPTPLKRAIKAT